MLERRIIYGTGATILAAAITLATVGVSVFRPDAYLSNAQFYFSTWFAAMLVVALWRLGRERPDSPFGAIRRHWVETDWPRLRQGLPLVICAILFMPSFSAVKSAIPLLNDYSWDATFIAWDRAIHGTDPWKLLQPFLGYPIVTSALSFAYHLWIVLIYIMNLYFALLVKDRVLTARFFLSFLLLWTIGGMVMAVMFASVGRALPGRSWVTRLSSSRWPTSRKPTGSSRCWCSMSSSCCCSGTSAANTGWGAGSPPCLRCMSAWPSCSSLPCATRAGSRPGPSAPSS
ncbi:MAG TPA: hypothetical protein PKD92_11150, partial [Novosphingobium sp.]|nr:hypothetical protein [Novosphingobium sp.]